MSSIEKSAPGRLKLCLLSLAAGAVSASCAGDCEAPSPDDIPESILDTGCVDTSDFVEGATGVHRYEVAQTFWSDGAEKERWFSLAEDTKMTVREDGTWELPVGAVTMKHFRRFEKLFETRFYVRDAENSYHGYTYRWNEDETDARLVDIGGEPGPVDEDLPWDYPSVAQCNTCHNESDGYFLGFKTRQLNIDVFGEGPVANGNQISELNLENMLDAENSNGSLVDLEDLDLQEPYTPDPYSPDFDLNATIAAGPAALEHAAKSYLDVNCGYCHNKTGFNESLFQNLFDARFDTSFADSEMCDDRLIQPGDPDGSVLLQRQSTRGPGKMPFLGTNLKDTKGTELLEAWIDSLNSCP